MTHQELIWQGVTALVTILTVVAAYLKGRRLHESDHTTTTHKLDQVQATVNGQNETLQRRVEQLTAALTAAGIAVPKTPAEGD
jgi:hypothetical protein